MKSLKESLFDPDNKKDDFVNLYQLFGDHIESIKFSQGTDKWFNYKFDNSSIARIETEWRKLGRPELSGSFNKGKFNDYFYKIITIFLGTTQSYKVYLQKTKMIGPLTSSVEFSDKDKNPTIYVIAPGSPDKQWKSKKGYEIRILFNHDFEDGSGSWLDVDLSILTDVIKL